MTDDEKFLEHLKLIQAVIARMASNSFSLKTLAATLTAGALALIGAAEDPWWALPAAAIVPTVVFWVLDSKYLTLEQKYRDLYDDVRKGRAPVDFDLNYNRATFAFQRTDVRNFLSWSVLWFYGAITIFLLIVSFYLTQQ